MKLSVIKTIAGTTKGDLIFITLIILISWIVWHGVLNQTIAGEGFYYFSPTNSFITPSGMTNIFKDFDSFPRFFTYLLENVFKGDMKPYMTAQFIIIILLNVMIYISLKKITGKSWLAFIAALYFGTNYTANFQLYARGHFQWFTQRVPEFFPILISMIFLSKFIDTKKVTYYFLSLPFFTLAILMTHYTTLFLPFFASFILISSLLKKGSDFKKSIILSLPFVIINYLIVSNSTLGLDVIRPKQTLLEALLQNKDVLSKISFQLVVATIPFNLLQFIQTISKVSYIQIIPTLYLPIYLFYFSIGFFLYKKRFSYLNLVVAAFLGLIGALFLNIFLGRINVYNEIEQGRYYYIPKLYLAIIISSFIYSLLLNMSKRLLLLKYCFIILLIFLYVTANTQFIWTKMKDSQRFYTGGNLMLNKLSQVKDTLPVDSIIMLPNPLMPLGIDFLKKYYKGHDIQYLFIDSKWKTKIPEGFDLNKFYVFDYSEEFNRGGNARLEFISVVDKSSEYRKLFLAK